MRILVVEDEPGKRESLAYNLEEAGHAVQAVADAEQAGELLLSGFDVLVADVRLPGRDGISLLKEAVERQPDLVAYMMTAFGSVETAVHAIRAGAEDYLVKPFPNEVLVQRIRRLADLRDARRHLADLKHALRVCEVSRDLVGQAASFVRALDTLDRASTSDATVLLLGESGTGKEVFARALHAASARSGGPFVPLPCAALPATLLESEMFGHEKGAFTGAASRRLGHFEVAGGGTIFLDDVDAMPLEVQPKLLRVLQERTLQRLGGGRPQEVDVHVVASARPNLHERVERGEFREDLYYRLHVVPIFLPPLRERAEDIPLLARHFLERFTPRGRRLEPSDAAIDALVRYPWPGNVRELHNVMERLCVTCDGPAIGVDDLPAEVRSPGTQAIGLEALLRQVDKRLVPWSRFLASAERAYVEWALGEAGGNVSAAADLLGIPRTTLRDRLRTG